MDFHGSSLRALPRILKERRLLFQFLAKVNPQPFPTYGAEEKRRCGRFAKNRFSIIDRQDDGDHCDCGLGQRSQFANALRYECDAGRIKK